MPSPDVAIRAAGLRLTAPRGFVFEALAGHPHATAEEVFSSVKQQHAQVSIQSVYNALGDFERVGLVQRIELASHPGRFELRVGDNHHHLVCSSCGKVEDVDCVTGQAPCLHVEHPEGYFIQRAEVTFWGVCESCSTSQNSM